MKQILSKLIITGLSLLMVACNSGSEGSSSINVGVMSPANSSDPSMHQDALDMKNAVILAVNQTNAKGGVNGVPIHLCFGDENATQVSVVAAVNYLVNSCHPVIIIGGDTSNETIGAESIATHYQVPIISPSATSNQLIGLSPYVFTLAGTNNQQATSLSGYLNNTSFNGKIAVIYDPVSLYSSDLAYSMMVGGYNPESLESFPYTGNTNELINNINQSEKSFSGYYIAGIDYGQTSTILTAIKTEYPSASYFGGDTWVNTSLLSVTGLTALNNVFTALTYANPNSSVVETFNQEFAEAFGYVPSGTQAAASYDTANLIIEDLAKLPAISSANLMAEINITTNFLGITGLVESFAQEVAQRDVTLLNAVTGNSTFTILNESQILVK